MFANRRSLFAFCLSAGSTLAIGLSGFTSAASAEPTQAAVPQYVIQFSALGIPGTTTGVQFQSTTCSIGPETNPIVVACKETGTIEFTTTGGSGKASVSSALAGINFSFTLIPSTAATGSYGIDGKGTETTGSGTSPVVLPVKVTGTLTVKPTPDPTFVGIEYVYPTLPPPA